MCCKYSSQFGKVRETSSRLTISRNHRMYLRKPTDLAGSILNLSSRWVSNTGKRHAQGKSVKSTKPGVWRPLKNRPFSRFSPSIITSSSSTKCVANFSIDNGRRDEKVVELLSYWHTHAGSGRPWPGLAADDKTRAACTHSHGTRGGHMAPSLTLHRLTPTPYASACPACALVATPPRDPWPGIQTRSRP